MTIKPQGALSAATRESYWAAAAQDVPTSSEGGLETGRAMDRHRQKIDSTVDNLGSEAIDTTGWQDYANCLGIDPELFFPERGASTREAKEACKGCVVREDCLEYALSNGEKFGIWGGLSERERRRIRRQRSIARRTALEADAQRNPVSD